MPTATSTSRGQHGEGLHQPGSYCTTTPDTYVQVLVRRGGPFSRQFNMFSPGLNRSSQRQSPIVGSYDRIQQATAQKVNVFVQGERI